MNLKQLNMVSLEEYGNYKEVRRPEEIREIVAKGVT